MIRSRRISPAAWGIEALLTVSPRVPGSSRPRPAYATWGLIALTVLVFAIQSAADEIRWSEIVLRYGVTPQIFTGGDRPFGQFPPFLTPLTAMFLHGSWDHLLGDIVFLWVFGTELEQLLGSLRFALLYLLSGICGALGYVMFDGGATVALLGASGAVSGVIAGYLMVRPCEPLAVPIGRFELRIAAYWAVGGWLLLQLFQFLWHSEEEVFSTLAQAGGALGGAIAFFALVPRGTRLFQCLHWRGDHASDTLE